MSAPPSTREWARQLLKAEAVSREASEPPRHEVVRVCETLRISLTRFAGADGFTALLCRPLRLARAEHPSLQGLTVTAGGRLEGLEELVAVDETAGYEAATAITSHLLSLLVTFIGENLTIRMLREAWPGVSLGESP